ncbi:MAG: flagellar biosynthesis protein FlgL [Cypionkella sp.]|jgi:flagellar hook-associated protein 3 FlgL|nr:flagellar biosynthesis protein FlgL [Cypionkella sp.]
MTTVSFGDLAQSFLLKSQSSRLRGEVGRLTQELSSGKTADPALGLSGDFTRLSALTRARTITEGYQSAAREAAAQASATQAALGTMSDKVQELIAPLLTASQMEIPEQRALIGSDARNRLNDVLSSMNTSVGGRALFAGVRIEGPAITDSDSLLAAVRGAMAGATTAEAAMAQISNWFDDPAGFAALAYLGDQPLADVAVAQTDKVWMGVTANDPAFRAMLTGLTAAALTADAGNPLPTAERRAFAQAAGTALLGAQAEMTQLAAKVGVSESRIDTAQSRNAADLLTLEMAEAELVTSDPYRTATELEAVQTNLETVYAITARLSRLTLTDFLR